MSINISNIKNKSKEALEYEDMRELPYALRTYFAAKKVKFDSEYDNRSNDTYLQRFRSTKYPVLDRLYGSPNEDICNIFLNMYQDQEVNDVIDEFLFERRWVYHPVRKFDKWNSISNLYYSTEDYYWVILIFNKIVDPFQDLLNFNVIRIPESGFVQSLPYRILFEFSGARFE